MRTTVNGISGRDITGCIFGTIVLAIGVMNVILVHPVPGIVCILLAIIYLPPADALLEKSFRIKIPAAVKIVLAILIIWFTLGVSDLGDIIDKWLQ